MECHSVLLLLLPWAATLIQPPSLDYHLSRIELEKKKMWFGSRLLKYKSPLRHSLSQLCTEIPARYPRGVLSNSTRGATERGGSASTRGKNRRENLNKQILYEVDALNQIGKRKKRHGVLVGCPKILRCDSASGTLPCQMRCPSFTLPSIHPSIHFFSSAHSHVAANGYPTKKN